MNDNMDEINKILKDAEEKNKSTNNEKPPKVPKNHGKNLTDWVKSLVLFIGYICSIVGAVTYLIVVIVMCIGFKTDGEIIRNITFSIITAVVGLFISQSLKLQGISFAKNEPEVKEVWEKYYKRKTKQRKYKSLKSFWVMSILFDVLLKALSVIAINIGVVYIFIEASGNIARIFMALANLVLFSGLGMTSLTKAYDFTKEQHTAWMLNQIDIENASDIEKTE